MNLMLSGFLVYLGILFKRPECRNVGAGIALMMVAEVGLYWFLSLYDGHRAPGFEWKDWKQQRD